MTGGEKPELTVCQVHAAICPQLIFWWHGKRVPPFLIEAIANKLQYDQDNRQTSRRSHRKRTIRRYHKLDIYLNQTIQCHWPDG